MIPYGKHFIDDDDIDSVVEVLRNGWLTQGPKIDEFESAFADIVGAKYAVAVSNATAGLHLACQVSGLAKGDTALLPPNTFVSTSNALLYCNATPVFVDIDPLTLNISPTAISNHLLMSDDVKAILPVHFGGLPCEMEQISEIATNHNLIVIEDAAHALGSLYECGASVGSCKYSDLTIFSLHPVKGVTTGEGGVITTNDYHLYKKLLRLRSHGICKGNFVHPGISKPDSDYLYSPERAFNSNGELNPWYYEMQELGFNYRMTDFQAALGLSQLGKLEKFVNRRRELALKYDDELGTLPFIQPAQAVDRSRSSIHIYTVRIDFKELGLERSQVMKLLLDKGVGSQVHYIPVHWQPYYVDLGYESSNCPQSIEYYEQALTLPLYYGLSDQELDLVIETLKSVLIA